MGSVSLDLQFQRHGHLSSDRWSVLVPFIFHCNDRGSKRDLHSVLNDRGRGVTMHFSPPHSSFPPFFSPFLSSKVMKKRRNEIEHKDRKKVMRQRTAHSEMWIQILNVFEKVRQISVKALPPLVIARKQIVYIRRFFDLLSLRRTRVRVCL